MNYKDWLNLDEDEVLRHLIIELDNENEELKERLDAVISTKGITLTEQQLENMFSHLFKNPGVSYKVHGPDLLAQVKRYLGFVKGEE